MKKIRWNYYEIIYKVKGRGRLPKYFSLQSEIGRTNYVLRIRVWLKPGAMEAMKYVLYFSTGSTLNQGDQPFYPYFNH